MLLILVGKLQIQIDDLFDLQTAVLELQIAGVEVVDDESVEGVVGIALEGVVVQDGLRVLPYALLEALC